jgi:hypothetical protein
MNNIMTAITPPLMPSSFSSGEGAGGFGYGSGFGGVGLFCPTQKPPSHLREAQLYLLWQVSPEHRRV